MKNSDNVILPVKESSMLEIACLLTKVAGHLTKAIDCEVSDYQVVTNKALLLLFEAHLKVVEQIEP